jgi:hypothetical protein
MKTIFYALIASVFIGYWGITFIFTMPDNYINISLFRQGEIFQAFFFQRWGFFAPPPNYDERIYYSFHSRENGKVQTFEIMRPLNLEKSAKAPFNSEADILDYIISNSVNGITEMMFEAQELRKNERVANGVTINNDNDEIETDTVYIKKLYTAIQQSTHFLALRNYGRIIAQKHDLNCNDYGLVISLSKKELPKFHERNNPKEKPEEIFFRSDPILFHDKGDELTYSGFGSQ